MLWLWRMRMFSNFGALKMGSNGQGFMYPILEQSKCKNCNSCYKVCPAVDDNLNKIRGAVKIGDVYSARNVDSEIRRKSSSGGGVLCLIRICSSK